MINKTIKKVLGILLILIGIVGLFLPFLQGIVLIILGISLVSPKLYRKIIKRFKRLKKR